MKQAAKDIKHFFPRVPIFAVKLADIGYFPIFVSIFDHWLYTDELNACEVTCYDHAVETQNLDEYLAGDAKLFSFYQRLGKRGVYIKEIKYSVVDQSIVEGPIPIEKESYSQVPVDDAGFAELLTERLRAEDTFHHDVQFYFPEFEVRSLKSSVRTDLLLLRDKTILPSLAKIACEHGVYLLDGDHLDNLDEDLVAHNLTK